MLAVTVLHNVGEGMFFPFEPATASLHHAHTFQIVADSPNQAADVMFQLCNLDPSEVSPLYRPQVVDYRRRMNRSLSVGDVLLMHELEPGADAKDLRVAGVVACNIVGWQGLEYVPEFEDGSNHHPQSASYLAHQARFTKQN